MNAALQFLLDNGGPVIRYRTLKELCDNADSGQMEEALQAVLAFPETQKRLERLQKQDLHNIHGATADCFENSLAMISDFGLSAANFDLAASIHVRDVIELYESLVHADRKNRHYQLTIYPFLLRLGFRDQELLNFIHERIEWISSFTREMDFAIYDDPAKHQGMPKNYRDRPVIRDGLYVDYDFKLPLIYDVIGMTAIYGESDECTRIKIDGILRYILTDAYHTFVVHYGIAKANGRYFAMGWDCLLPYFSEKANFIQSKSLYVQRLSLFSVFPAVRSSAWFKNGVEDLLTNFHTSRDTYLFPKDYVCESDKNWCLGSHMGLGENRRKSSWREVESTFWALLLKKNAGVL